MTGKKRDWRKLISNVLIGSGVLLLVVFGGYKAATYPWKLLLYNWGVIEVSADLPEPDPLPAAALDPTAEPAGQGGGIPSQPYVFQERPSMNLNVLGSIKIPKLGVSQNIVEGSGDELLYAVGHVRSTAYPGEGRNCVLAGHRGYVLMNPFRYLDKLAEGDRVLVTFDGEQHTYEVFKMFEIEPDENWVLSDQPEQGELLTLITCTPVITYTHRLIVWCRPVDSTAAA